MMSFLADISRKGSTPLRHTTTRVTTKDGKVHEEEKTTSGTYTLTVREGARPFGFVVDTEPDLQVAEVRPRLWMGSQDVVAEKESAAALGITHVLNVAGSSIPQLYPDAFAYRTVEILDVPEQKIQDKLPCCFKFIDDALKDSTGDSKVYVHCNAGVSRSATVVIAYLMARENMGYDEAFATVASKRPVIRPNEGFKSQLRDLEATGFPQC